MPEIIEKMKKIYKFKRKKEFVIKKFEKIRGW